MCFEHNECDELVVAMIFCVCHSCGEYFEMSVRYRIECVTVTSFQG